MNRWVLLDTDVFSFLFKRDTRAALYAPHVQNTHLCLSFQTIAELRYWALIRRWGETRRRSLDTSLARCLVFPFDDAITREWAALMFHRRSMGKPIECGDAWVAATAIRHDLLLLTHNSGHYADIPGLRLITHG